MIDKENEKIITVELDFYKNFRPSTFQLFDIITMIFYRNGAKSPRVTLTLFEYMEIRKLKDRKKAKKRLKLDLKTLLETSISFNKKEKGRISSIAILKMADNLITLNEYKFIFIFKKCSLDFFIKTLGSFKYLKSHILKSRKEIPRSAKLLYHIAKNCE